MGFNKKKKYSQWSRAPNMLLEIYPSPVPAHTDLPPSELVAQTILMENRHTATFSFPKARPSFVQFGSVQPLIKSC